MDSVLEAKNYRQIVEIKLAALPGKGRGALTKLSQHLNVHGTWVSQVLKGQKDFTLEQAFGVCSFFNLLDFEREIFLLMVQMERAGTQELRKFFSDKIEELRKNARSLVNRVRPEKTLNDSERAIFYSSWLYSAVRMFCSIDDGKTLTEIEEKFGGKKSREVVEFLLQTQLITLNGAKFKIGQRSTHLEKDSPYISRHHTNWHMQTMKRIDELTDEELIYSSPFSMNEKDFLAFREEVVKLIQSFVERAKASEATEVGVFTTGLTWLK